MRRHHILDYFQRFIKTIGFALLLMSQSATNAISQTSAVSKKNRTAASIIETIPLNSNRAIFTAVNGTVGYSGNGLQVFANNNSGEIDPTVSVPIMPYVANSKTKDEILVSAKQYLLPYANTLGTNLKSWLAVNNYKAGSFIYEHDLTPKNAGRTMKLVWQLSVADGGRVLFGAPRLIDGDPVFIYLTYTPMTVSTGLPSSWTYPDAGLLKWQLRKRDGTPATPWASIQTNGAFDDRDNGDTNFGVNCLGDAQIYPDCPVGYIDAKTLISQNSASGAIVDYVRRLAPVYTTTTDGNGQPIQQARVSVSVNTRNYTPSDCTHGKYQNAGQYGFTLQSTLDRFVLSEADKTPNLVNSYTSYSISPTQSYDYTIQVTNEKTSTLQSLILNPFDLQGPLVNASVVPNLTYLAPLSVTNTVGDLSLIDAGGIPGLTTYWTGSKFVVSAVSGESGYAIVSRALTLNIPFCRITSARITKNQADDGQAFVINNRGVTATDTWQGDIPNTGISGKATIAYLTSPYYNCGRRPRTFLCDATTSKGVNARAYLGEMNGSVGDSNLPIDILPYLVDGTNVFSIAHMVVDGGSFSFQLEFEITPP
jgi:hypothetical protein